jgi:glycerophosphoryl diester phosphodiesterase
MQKIGHRGAKGYEPENTLISFQKALDLGVNQIELDIHLSNDGAIMVIHDKTIDRISNGTGLVTDLRCLQLQQFQLDKKQYIPTLEEVLNLIDKKCSVNIEIKSANLVEKLVLLIERFVSEKQWNYEHFLVSSFEWVILEQLRNLLSQIPIAVLTEKNIEQALAFAKKIKAQAINPNFQLVTNENVGDMQKAGFKVYPWTVNEIADINRMKKYKVDGIISDFPDRL